MLGLGKEFLTQATTRRNHKDVEQKGGCWGWAGQGKTGSHRFVGTEFQFCKGRRALGMDGGDDPTITWKC